MIESHLHPLDEIRRFGFTAHGLVNGSVTGNRRLRVGATNHPLPYAWPFNTGEFVEFYDTHLLRTPGVPPVVMPMEEYLSERAAGRTWQHYAVLSEDRCMLFGTPLHGWVCIDPAGRRWIVRTEPQANTGSIRADEPLSMTIRVRPFGYLDEPVVPWHALTVTLDDLGQVGDGAAYPPSGSLLDPNDMILRLGSVASHGRSAVLEIHGTVSLAQNLTRRRVMPAGFLLLELTGNGPDFTATLTVMRARAQALGAAYGEFSGSIVDSAVGIQWKATETPEVVDGQPGWRVVAEVEATPSYATPAGYTPLGSGVWTYGRRDRVLGLVYDDADNLVELTCDTELRLDAAYPGFVLEQATGSLSAWRPEGSASPWTATPTGSVALTALRTLTEQLSLTVTIRRNGVPVGRAVATGSNIVEERRYSDGGGLLTWDGTGYYGRETIVEVPTLAGRAYSRTTTWQADEEAGAVTWGRSFAPDSELYSLQQLLSTTNIERSQGPYVMWPTFGVLNGGENYGGALIEVLRLANNCWSCKVTALAGTQPSRVRYPFIVAPQAEWQNPADRDLADRQASYHPYTHDIATSAGSIDIPVPFVWS